jgi:hypothetical protein
MEDDLLDPAKEDRRKIRNIFSTFDDVQTQPEGDRPALPAPVTDPNANPFPDVPLPADFREVPLPPIESGKEEPAVGDFTSDIQEELDRHERRAR